MSLKTFLQKLFPFLFKAMQRAWDALPGYQQDAVLNSGTIGQILKTNLDTATEELIALIIKKTGLPAYYVDDVLIGLARVFGYQTNSVNDATAYLQKKLSGAASNEEWNGLLTIILNAGATLLTGGTLKWAQIAIGLGEWAYQKFIKAA